jgi:hypothetical protein
MSARTHVNPAFLESSLRHEPGYQVKAVEAHCVLVVLVIET